MAALQLYVALAGGLWTGALLEVTELSRARLEAAAAFGTGELLNGMGCAGCIGADKGA